MFQNETASYFVNGIPVSAARAYAFMQTHLARRGLAIADVFPDGLEGDTEDFIAHISDGAVTVTRKTTPAPPAPASATLATMRARIAELERVRVDKEKAIAILAAAHLAEVNRRAELEAALRQVERLSRTADRAKLDVAAMLGDIARAALGVKD